VVFGCGLLSFVGFVYVGLRVRTRKFWIALVIGCVGSALPWLASADSDPATEGSQLSDVGTGIVLAAWVGLVVYGFILNRDYLRWRAARTPASAWYNQPTVGSSGAPAPLAPAPTPYAAPQASRTAATPVDQPRYHDPVSDLGVDPRQFYASGQAASAPGPAPAPSAAGRVPPVPQRPHATPGGHIATGPVDINTASTADIAAAAGGDAGLADRIVAAREQRGAFRDLDDLVASASIQPHEFIELRANVAFSRTVPPPTGGSSPANLGPEPPEPPGQQAGRILDF